VTTYTINICPECGEQEIEDREGDPICPRHGWKVDWQEIEVVPVSDREYLDSVIAESKQRLARIMDLKDALREIATRPKVELNPDGVDQAAYTMALIAEDALR
jgi:hypothetical protein